MIAKPVNVRAAEIATFGCLGRDTKVNRCLAEGRKSFLERYAGIESGQECQRLAPTLSAFVDGEADTAQTVALRAHLRQCLACRAAVRGLHDASRPLAVVFPATGAVLANGGIEHTGSFFVRVYETVSLSLHERAANSFLRAQAVFDTVTAGKMAVAAASAAAVAGGGFAVQGVVGSGPTDRPSAILRGDAGAGALPVLKKVSQSQARPKRRAPSHKKAQPRQRSRVKPRQAAQPAPAPATTTTTTTATVSRPRASAASAGASHPGASAAAGEFGFEGP